MIAQAAVCTSLTGEDGVEVIDWPVAALGPGEIMLDVRAGSVNFPDCLMTRGEYQHSLEPPYVVGSECAGVVSAVADDVSAVKVGDRVLALAGAGSFITRMVVPAGMQVHPIPDQMPFDEAAAFCMTYGTAYHGLIRRGQLQAGERVLILGASGGCGSAAVQVAKAAGAEVVAVAGGSEKCELVRSLGADVVLDHQAFSSIDEAVRAATEGRGVDVVFDPVGGEDIRDVLRCLSWNGRYLVVGFAGGGIPVVRLNQTIVKGISLVGVAFGVSAVRDLKQNREDFAQLFTWYNDGLVRPTIGHRLPLSRTADALRIVSSRRATGKVVVEMPH